MSVEVAIVISIVSLAFAIYEGVSNLRRNNKKEDKAEASELTTVIVKLENISTGVSEIKADMKDLKSDVKDHSERIVRLEQQVKVLNKTTFSTEGE